MMRRVKVIPFVSKQNESYQENDLRETSKDTNPDQHQNIHHSSDQTMQQGTSDLQSPQDGLVISYNDQLFPVTLDPIKKCWVVETTLSSCLNADFDGDECNIFIPSDQDVLLSASSVDQPSTMQMVD